MAMVFLMGYKWLDFPPKDDPNKRIKGFSIFLGIQERDTYGVVPVGDGGKRFVNETLAQRLGLNSKFFEDNLYDFINVDINFDGKVVGVSALTEEQKQSPYYPFSTAGPSASQASASSTAAGGNSGRYPF